MENTILLTLGKVINNILEPIIYLPRDLVSRGGVSWHFRHQAAEVNPLFSGAGVHEY